MKRVKCNITKAMDELRDKINKHEKEVEFENEKNELLEELKKFDKKK